MFSCASLRITSETITHVVRRLVWEKVIARFRKLQHCEVGSICGAVVNDVRLLRMMHRIYAAFK